MLSEVRSKMTIFWHLCPDKILPFMSAPGSDLMFFGRFRPHEVSDIQNTRTYKSIQDFWVRYRVVVQRLSLFGRLLIFVKRQPGYAVILIEVGPGRDDLTLTTRVLYDFAQFVQGVDV